MKFFMCCGHGARQQPPEESRLLVVPEARPRVGRRKRGRQMRCGAIDWRPSLSSISEDNVLPERNTVQPLPPRILESRGGGVSVTHRDRAHSSNHNGVRRASVPAVLPTVSPSPFFFL